MVKAAGVIEEWIDDYLRSGLGVVDLKSGTIGGENILGGGSSSSISPTFGSWTEADADDDAKLTLEATAETDGTTDGLVEVEVDESGGTTADYTLTLAFADAGLGSGIVENVTSVHVPAGAQYRVVNTSDPNAANSIAGRQLTM